MIIDLTKRERATILAALRRWLSYPAAREADSIATNGGKRKPLDNAEIERLCKRITELDTKRDTTRMIGQANGARERKALKLRDGHVRPGMAIISDLVTQKVGAIFGSL